MRTTFFILITATILFNGCKKSDSDPQPNSLAKVWQPQSVVMTAPANNQSLTLYLRKNYTNNMIDYSTYLMYLGSDGVLTITNNGKSDTGTWQFTNNQLTLNYSCCDKEVFTVETATATNLDIYYQVFEGTKNTSEQDFLTAAKSYGLDTSKGVKLIIRFTSI